MLGRRARQPNWPASMVRRRGRINGRLTGRGADAHVGRHGAGMLDRLPQGGRRLEIPPSIPIGWAVARRRSTGDRTTGRGEAL